MAQIIPTTEPFYLPGDRSRPACLLIHGFTGTPKEMRWMGEYLNRQGHACLGIRLPGHATRPEDMILSRWTDWTAAVEDGYHQLCSVSDEVFLIGLSMGGTLSLLMSTRLDVKGVVAMSTPARLPVDYPLWLIELLSPLMRFRPKAAEPPGTGWYDETGYQEHVSYRQYPVRAVAELKRLIREMHTALPQVRVPVLLMHSADDTYVLPESMETIYRGLSNTADRTKLSITGSGHVLTRDASRQQVFQATADFIQRVCSQT